MGDQRRVLRVTMGICEWTGPRQRWFTCFRKPNGSLCRVKSKNLPERGKRAEAEADLARYAERHRLQAVTIPEQD